MQVLLYGDKNLPNDLNKSILLLTLNFIHQTGRLDQGRIQPEVEGGQLEEWAPKIQ